MSKTKPPAKKKPPLFTRSEWLSVIALIVAIANTAWTVTWTIRTHIVAVSARQVMRVLSAEAAAALSHSVDAALQLYVDPSESEQPVVRSMEDPPRVWTGREEIRQRYEGLPSFLRLAHVAPTVTFDPTFTVARVQAGTSGRISEGQGQEREISSIRGEEWTLRRIGRTWRIVDFTYGLP